MTAPFTVRTVVDLIAIAPQLLGFRPEESLVVVTFGSPAGNFHARVDLPPDDAGRAEVRSLIVGACRRNRVRKVALLAFSAEAAVTRAMLEVLVVGLVDAGVEVVDAVRVDGERYYLELEGDAEGTDYDVAGHPITARAVFEGRIVAESRAAVAATLDCRDPDDRAAVAEATRPLRDTGGRDQGRWLGRRVRTFLRDREPLSAVDAARALVLCSDQSLREAVWAEITRDDAERHVELWRDLTRRAPDELRAPVAGLLAFSAWLSGDGALAWCAVDRCVELDPEDAMARMVGTLLQNAVPPTVWRRYAAGRGDHDDHGDRPRAG